jgi:hypothetical protein
MTDGLRINRYAMEPFSHATTTAPPSTLAEHLISLPEHESVLVQHHELLAGDATTTCGLMADMSKVFLVSDGGAAADHGSYGWVLGLEDGTRLAKGWGKDFRA